MDELRKQLANIEHEIRMEEQRGALADGGKIATLQAQRQQIVIDLTNVNAAAEKQEIEAKQVEHTGGLKENLFSMFEILFPRDTFVELIGPADYSDKQQLFNQMIDLNVEAANTALYEHVGHQLEAKDARIQELTVAAIQRDGELEQARNEAELAKSEADAADKRYTEMLSEYRTLEAKYADALNTIADRDREIEGRDMVIKAKEGEIQELREQLNRAPAPRAGFMDVTPDVTSKLQELKAKADENNNRIKSRLDLVLEGNTTRGTVMILGADEKPLITPPALVLNGGSELQESFRHEDTQANDSDREGTAEVSETESVEQFQTSDLSGSAGDSADGEVAAQETVSREEFDALKHEVTMLAVELKARAILPNNWEAA